MTLPSKPTQSYSHSASSRITRCVVGIASTILLSACGGAGSDNTTEQPVTEPPATDQPVNELAPLNQSPVITDTSYKCDPLTELVSLSVGDSDRFTLDVDDESPQTLRYSADSSNKEVVSISVDTNGVFTVTALSTGESFLWLTAEDSDALADEYQLRVVVD